MSALLEALEEARVWRARAEKAEAERDEARTALIRAVSDKTVLSDERDEARAEVARLQDLHTRCAAFDDQPGPSCVTLAAEVARLREALNAAADALSSIDCAPDCVEGDRCKHCMNWQRACDALADTSDEEGR